MEKTLLKRDMANNTPCQCGPAQQQTNRKSKTHDPPIPPVGFSGVLAVRFHKRKPPGSFLGANPNFLLPWSLFSRGPFYPDSLVIIGGTPQFHPVSPLVVASSVITGSYHKGRLSVLIIITTRGTDTSSRRNAELQISHVAASTPVGALFQLSELSFQ